MYQLQTPGEMSNRSNHPFIDKEMDQEGPVQDRQCTDIVCLILFFLFLGAFIGILIYAIVTGSPVQAISIHNANGVACYKNSNFPNGFFPDPSSPKNAVCVAKCPESKQTTVNCLTDSVNCPSGSITSTYGTFQILTYCILDPSITGQSFSQTFNVKVVVQWIFDVQKGYFVLIGAVVLSIIIVVLYTCLLRCITGCLLYSSFVVIQLILVGVGILLILQGSGVAISNSIPINLAHLGKVQMLIAGSVLIFIGILFVLVIICMCNKIKLGVSIVQTASTFVSQRFYMLLMPIISTIFFFGALAAIVTGGLYLYGTGQRSLHSGDAFYTINFNVGLIIMNSVFGFAGIWIVFWIFYSNIFVIMSAAAVWYYQQDSPLCSSFGRLVRYHSGSICFTSLLFGFLFILRLISKFFYLRNEQYSNKCLQYTIRTITFCFCIFDILLKFLSEGIYVQIAVKGTNYCSSTINAFQLIASNPLKLALAGGISYLVGIIGVLFTTSIVCGTVYLVQVYVPQFNGVLTDPVPMTVISGLAVIIISAIFLSILSDSSQSLIQCYVMDETHERAKGGKAKFVPETLRIIFQQHQQI